MARNAILGLALVFLTGFVLVGALTKPTSIKLVNNAYSGIVVAIHQDVPENQTLVNIIKGMFTEGSLYLYNATKQRSYFHNVTILIPKTWRSRPEYRQASNQSFDLADVIVAPPNPRWAPDPYTKQYQGCGKEGVHIHFWDQFLLEPFIEDYYGPLGRVLVHEWGHYRWGLFDEYADPVGDPDNYQEFYFNYITQKWEGVRCSYDYNGIAVKFFPNLLPYYRPCIGNSTVGYEDGCVYVTQPDGHNTTGSIMFGRQYYDQIVDFCDSNPLDRPNLHNREAPNKHNRLCDYRSAWEVMRRSPDFEDENNSPRDIDPADLIPEFILVQHEEIRVVMVLDVSDSMAVDMKFIKMISSAANYISSIVIEGSRIGIVQFEDTSEVLSSLVTVYSDDDRQDLLDALPKGYKGATCIGCGLQDALQVLESGGDPAGGIILLLSDGKENRDPRIDDVKDSLVAAGVIVDTIAFTQAAEGALYDLALLTGGTPYYYSNQPGDNTLYDAFAATMERGEIDDHDRRVQLMGNSWKLNAEESRSDAVFLDNTIGRRTEFTFQWTTSPAGVDIETWVTKPDGSVLDSTYPGYGIDKTFKLITYKIVDTAEPGSWSFTIRNPQPTQEDEVFFTVTSYATDPNVDPILVTSELSGSFTDFANGEPIIAYAEVKQGFSPIIYAEVWARIDRPGNYGPVDIELLDNGAGADITKYDGVYSRYFTQFTEPGFYGIKITVVNNGTAIVLGDRPVSRAIPNLPPEEGDNPPKVGNDTVRPPWTPPTEPTGEPAPKFTRGVSGGSSSVDVPPGYVPGNDYIAPGRIIDLRVSGTSFENASVTLSWSAPGDDLDSGATQYYDIRRADTIPELLNNFLDAIPINQSDLVFGDLDAPQEFGNIEQFVITVPINENTTIASYAFAVQAWDDANPPLSSNVSNIVQATLRKFIPATGAPPTESPLPSSPTVRTSPPTRPSSPEPHSTKGVSPSQPPIAVPEKTVLSIGAIIGIVLGSLVGLVLLLSPIVIVGVIIVAARPSSKTPETDVPLSATSPPPDSPPYYENTNMPK